MATVETNVYDHLPASSDQLDSVVKAWFGYVSRKTQVHPHLRAGIVPRYIEDYHLPADQTRTVKFSLVNGVAPELAGLGEIVGSGTPHVYVEGIRNPLVRAGFEEFYIARSSEFMAGSHLDKLRKAILADGVIPGSFLMHIYVSDDLDQSGRVTETQADEMVLFMANDIRVHGYTLSLGYLEYDLNPLSNSHPLHNTLDKLFHLYRSKPVKVNPITHSQSLTLTRSLKEATDSL